MPQLIIIIMVILLPYLGVSASQGLNYDRSECPCLTVVDDEGPWKSKLATGTDECQQFCEDNIDRCMAFNYCFVTKKCELYSQKTLTYTFGAVHDLNCTANPTERQPTLKKWYVLGESCDCVQLKQEDPSLPSDFYEIKVKGRPIEVFCNMSMTPVGTYLNLTHEYETKSRWGGSDFVQEDLYEYSIQNLYYQMARLVVKPCLVYIQCNDLTYSSGIDWDFIPSSIENYVFYIGQGGDCNENKAPHRFAGHQLNLEDSGLRLAPGLDWKVTGTSTYLKNKRLKPQFSKIWGSGNCSRIVKVFGGWNEYIDPEILPLTVFDSDLIKTSTLPITEGTSTLPVPITTTTLPAFICSIETYFTDRDGVLASLSGCPPLDFWQLLSYWTVPHNDYASESIYYNLALTELGSEQYTFFDDIGTHWQHLSS